MERKEKERKNSKNRKGGKEGTGQDRTRAKHGDTHCHLWTQEEDQKFKVTLNYIKTLSQNKGREGGRKEGRQGKEESPQNLNWPLKPPDCSPGILHYMLW